MKAKHLIGGEEVIHRYTLQVRDFQTPEEFDSIEKLFDALRPCLVDQPFGRSVYIMKTRADSNEEKK